MNSSSLVQSFAVNQEGKVVSVDEVSRGLECRCNCSICGAPLMAKQGEQRIWHFAHATGNDCEGSAETALHLAAKQVLQQSMGLEIPEIIVEGTAQLADGRRASAQEVIPESWLDFETVLLEQELAPIRPDVIGQSGSNKFIIEIAVTHFVDEHKRALLEALGFPAIEVQLDPSLRESWTWDALEEIVVHGTEFKSWISLPDLSELTALANARAYEMASAQTPFNQTQTTENSKPSKIRFTIQGMIVDVNELNFGVTVWSPYHPEVNEIIKNIVKPLGGRWQPKYRNWLLPKAMKPFLISALDVAIKTCVA
jgi:competence protein CoiA